MPYKTLALITPYTFQLENLLSEVHRLKHLFNANLVIICFDEQLKKNDSFAELLKKWDLNEPEEKVKVYYRKAPSVDNIIEIFRKEEVDLVITHSFTQKKSMIESLNNFAKGLFINELTFKRYISLLSKRILKRLDTSLLLLQNPTLTPKRFEKIVVNNHSNMLPTQQKEVLKHAFYFAKHERSEKIIILKESGLVRLHSLMTDNLLEQESSPEEIIKEKEINQLHAILNSFDTEGMNIAIKLVTGQIAYKMTEFSAENQADLIVTPLSDYHPKLIDRMLGNHLEHLLNSLPCNLLLVHHR